LKFQADNEAPVQKLVSSDNDFEMVSKDDYVNMKSGAKISPVV